MAQEFKIGDHVILVSPVEGRELEQIGLKGKIAKLEQDKVTVNWDAGHVGTYEKWRLTRMPIVD